MKKTDNHNLADKLAIRRALLREIPAPLHVLDLFSGEGRIWEALGKEFEVASYTPVDVKPRQPGTIRMTVDARTVRAFDPAQFNVIDVDAYGDPWAIWNELRARMAPPAAVFLTFGHLQPLSTKISDYLKTACGIPEDWEIPADTALATYFGRYYFERSLRMIGVRRALAIEHQRVSYYGALFGAEQPIDTPKPLGSE